MKRNYLLYFLKLTLVVCLITYVFSHIQWQDRYHHQAADGTTSTVHTGKILGPWDHSEIRFVPNNENSKPALLLQSGSQADGSRIDITPGITTYIANFDWRFLPLAILTFVLCASVAGTRWWWLLHINQLPVGWWEAIRYTWIGMFFNNVMPGQTGGDLIKAVYLVKKCKTQRIPALLSILVDRILGLSSLLLLGGMATFFAWERFSEIALGIWALLAFLLGSATFFFSHRLRRRFATGKLFPFLPLFLQGLLSRIDQSITLYKGHMVGIGLCLLIGVANQSLYVLTVILLGKGLGVGLPSLEYFVLVPLITIISALPLAPNGWGIGELAFGYMFSTYGASHLAHLPSIEAELAMRTRGVALSVLFRIHSSLLSLLGGVFLVVKSKDQLSRQEIEEESKLEKEEKMDVQEK